MRRKLPTGGTGVARLRPTYTAEADVPTVTLVRGHDGRIAQAIVSGRDMDPEYAQGVMRVAKRFLMEQRGALGLSSEWRVRII